MRATIRVTEHDLVIEAMLREALGVSPTAIHMCDKRVVVNTLGGETGMPNIALHPDSWSKTLLGKELPVTFPAIFRLELPLPRPLTAGKSEEPEEQQPPTYIAFKAVAGGPDSLTLFPLIWPPIIPSWPEAMEKNRGLIIISGERRSGRTVTAMALINKIIGSFGLSTAALVMPAAEYELQPRGCLVEHCLSDDYSMVSAFERRDFDVVYLDEIPDIGVLGKVLDVAESRLIVACGPSSSTTETIERLIEMEPDGTRQEFLRRRLARALVGIIGQELLQKQDHSGLVVATEVLLATPAVQNLIRENKGYRLLNAMQTGHKHGMRLLDEDLFRLFKEGLIDQEKAIEAAHHPDDQEARVTGNTKQE